VSYVKDQNINIFKVCLWRVSKPI